MRPLAVIAFAASVAVGYVLASALGLPMIWLDSASGAWSAGPKPSSAAMDFFGRSAWGMALGLVAALGCARLAVNERRARVAAVLSAVAIAGALGVEVWRLSSRVPVAEDYPAGYDPVTGRVVLPGPTRLAGP